MSVKKPTTKSKPTPPTLPTSASTEGHQRQATKAIWASTLTTTEKILMLAYTTFLNNQDWDVWPGAVTLARMTGLTVRWVHKIRGDLLDLGVIAVAGQHPRQRRKGHPKSGRYTLCIAIKIDALRARDQAQAAIEDVLA